MMKFPGEMSSASSLSTVINNDDATLMIHGLEFPKDDAELDADPSDSDGYLSEDPECPYYSDSEDEKAAEDCIMEDGLYRQNDDMNRDIKKQKKKLKKLLDKDPGFANFLENGSRIWRATEAKETLMKMEWILWMMMITPMIEMTQMLRPLQARL